MSAAWRVTYTFIGERGVTTRRTHILTSAGVDLSLEFQAILTDADALLVDYRAASLAGVGMQIAVIDDAWAADAPAADSDPSDVAFMNLRLDADPDGKLAPFNLPAPVDAAFVGGAAGTEVDPSATVLTDLVANFTSGNFEISDGEHVDQTLTGGIKDGEWRSRKFNPR